MIRTKSLTAGVGSEMKLDTDRVRSGKRKFQEIDTEQVAQKVLARTNSLPASSSKVDVAPAQSASQSTSVLTSTVFRKSTRKAEAEMQENTVKALQDHRMREKDRSVYPSRVPVEGPCISSLVLKHEIAAEQGRRRSMEDAHLFAKISGGYLAGVFDGHGGIEVAQLAAEKYPVVFPQELQKSCGNVQSAFEGTVKDIQDAVFKRRDCLFTGSTGVVSYIAEETGDIYTATTGDSEAFLYRKDERGHLKSIPLSVVKNWSDPDEAQRASKMAKTLGERQRIEQWPNSSNPKTVRVRNGKNMGVNVSRAFGDFSYPEVNSKPLVTKHRWEEGDILGIFCDGVTDYVSQREMIELIKDNPTQIAAKIADFAIRYKTSDDNVSVMIVKEES